jgi:NAD(P)H-quinone oxidoreductase subunit 5
MNSAILLERLGILVVASPAVLVAVLGLSTVSRWPLSERAIHRWTFGTVVIALLAAVGVLTGMLVTGTREIPVEVGHWAVIPQEHFHFHVKFLFDWLSVPFVILALVLSGTIGAFTTRYLHREPGYRRFAMCYALFALGIAVTSVAGTIEVLFFGWEFVGLSSALLVGFFHERAAPVKNASRIWCVYRISDAALLIAALALHHLTGEGDFDLLIGAGPWPGGVARLAANQALFIGALLLFAAMGKSGLVPFSGWLPRAMEGPTPSSAVFYGALSVHLGAFLLLRVGPVLELSPVLSGAVVVIGLLTAMTAAASARVQTDIKTSLAYASLTQVGIIVAEIGFGLRVIPLIHIIGHACLRTLQLLRAPSLLRDYHTLENAIGGHLPHHDTWGSGIVPHAWKVWSYRLAIERFYFDAWLDMLVVRPCVAVFEWCDRSERRWTDWLAGGHSRESDDVCPHDAVIEEAP